MSSHKKQSHPKKKNRADGKGGRRKRNLIKRQHYQEPTSKKRKIQRSGRKYAQTDKKFAFPHPNYVPYLLKTNLKTPDKLDKETSIKYHLKALEKDIKIYEKLKEDDSARTLISQIQRQYLELEEKLSNFNLPMEKLEEFKKNYELIKKRLKDINFYKDAEKYKQDNNN